MKPTKIDCFGCDSPPNSYLYLWDVLVALLALRFFLPPAAEDAAAGGDVDVGVMQVAEENVRPMRGAAAPRRSGPRSRFL